MTKQNITGLAILVLLIIGGAVYILPVSTPDPRQPTEQNQTATATTANAYLQAGDRCIQLAVAETPQQKQLGLSEYDDLGSDEGMLFPYAEADRHGFWMKNMSFPIDIIWLDDNDVAVTVRESVSPESYPETFYPTKPAKNVVEVASGTAAELNLKSGDPVNIVRPTTTPPVGC